MDWMDGLGLGSAGLLYEHRIAMLIRFQVVINIRFEEPIGEEILSEANLKRLVDNIFCPQLAAALKKRVF